MHPILFHLGRLAIPTAGVLTAFGLLAGLELSCLLARRRGLAPDRIWNLGLSALLTFFLGERMLVIAFNLRDFVAHPLWMLGLATVRDERYLAGGSALAICAGIGYITAWRLPWRSVLDVLAPGAGCALAWTSLGSLAAGADFGRETSAGWGIIYSSRVAARFSGTPLGVPLLPVALYAALLHGLLAAGAVLLLLRARPTGAVAAFWLCTTGFFIVLLAQLRYPAAQEVLIGGCFTPAQCIGMVALAAAAFLALEPTPMLAGRTPSAQGNSYR